MVGFGKSDLIQIPLIQGDILDRLNLLYPVEERTIHP